MPDIAEYVQQAFASAGYGKRMVEATGRYARLVLRLPGSGDELEMDLLKEALGSGGITVQGRLPLRVAVTIAGLSRL